jgi:hypothetical protein
MPDKEPGWISAVRIFFGALAVVFMVGVDYLNLFGEDFPNFIRRTCESLVREIGIPVGKR